MKPPEVLKAELANHTKQARNLHRFLRDSSPPFRTDPKRCRPTRRSINHRQGRDGSNRKKTHPHLLAAPSRYSTSWVPRSTRLPQLQPPPPPPIPRCSQKNVTDSSHPPSALRAPPLTCDVRAPNSHYVMTHRDARRCLVACSSPH